MKKELLKEYYKGDLYHFTDLYSAALIMNSDGIHNYEDSEWKVDSRLENSPKQNYGNKFVSLSRNGSIKVGYGKTYTNTARFTIDSDSLMTLRNARLYPFAYFDDFKTSEYEERFYGGIIPLDKIKQIDLFIEAIEYLGYRADYIEYDDGGYLGDSGEETNINLINAIVRLAKERNIPCLIHGYEIDESKHRNKKITLSESQFKRILKSFVK